MKNSIPLLLGLLVLVGVILFIWWKASSEPLDFTLTKKGSTIEINGIVDSEDTKAQIIKAATFDGIKPEQGVTVGRNTKRLPSYDPAVAGIRALFSATQNGKVAINAKRVEVTGLVTDKATKQAILEQFSSSELGSLELIDRIRIPLVHPPKGFIPDWSRLDAYQGTISRSELVRLIEEVYTVGDTWKEVIKIGENEAEILMKDDDYYTLKLRPEDEPAPETVERYWKKGPLDTLHIAIDPGHIGGDFAKIEEREFGRPEDKPVREGSMTLITAKLLKPQLEAMGAKVTLVRSDNTPVTSRRAEDFTKLYKQYNPDWPEALLRPYAESRFYRRDEITERARLVNEVIKPDIVLCLHYNASSGSGDWASPKAPVFSEENHLHFLLNGAYTRGEVLAEEDRFQMMERILQRIHEREVELSLVIADTFVEHTGLPPYSYDAESKRAKNVAGHPYLWARNLLANRSYTCPVIFFEPWVMNNKEVYDRIQAGDYEGEKEVAGKLRPSIMREYADAVADGISNFFEQNQKN